MTRQTNSDNLTFRISGALLRNIRYYANPEYMDVYGGGIAGFMVGAVNAFFQGMKSHYASVLRGMIQEYHAALSEYAKLYTTVRAQRKALARLEQLVSERRKTLHAQQQAFSEMQGALNCLRNNIAYDRSRIRKDYNGLSQQIARLTRLYVRMVSQRAAHVLVKDAHAAMKRGEDPLVTELYLDRECMALREDIREYVRLSIRERLLRMHLERLAQTATPDAQTRTTHPHTGGRPRG